MIPPWNCCAEPLRTILVGNVHQTNDNFLIFSVYNSIFFSIGTIKIRLWDAHCQLVDGSSYTFENLKVREFNGQKFLTTSPSTQASLVNEDFPHPDEHEVNDLTTITISGFKMVNNFSTWFTCLNCSKHLTDVPTLKTAKCSHCESIMLLTSCPKLMSVRVAVEDPSKEKQHIWLTAFRDVLLLMIPELGSQCNPSEDEIVQGLLDLENFQITFDKSANIIRSFEI